MVTQASQQRPYKSQGPGAEVKSAGQKAADEKNTSSTVAVIGCGWLGLPLAQTLLEKGFAVCGTTTHPAKLKVLRDLGIDSTLLRLDPEQSDVHSELISNEGLNRLFECPQLVFNVPPNGLQSSKDHIGQLESLLTRVDADCLKHFVFVSSTSVYGDLCGPDVKFKHGHVTEETVPQASQGNGLILMETEQYLLDLVKDQDFGLTIVRSGGQIGFGRHPGRFLAGRENLRDPDHPVNLIHQKDLIRALCELLILPPPSPGQSRVLNAVASTHPTRREFYRASSLKLGLTAPEFGPQDPGRMPGKTILSDELRKTTQTPFEFDDLVTALMERDLS